MIYEATGWQAAQFLEELAWQFASVSRLDIAIDDKQGLLNLALIEDKLAAGEVTTRWRKFRPMEADKEIGGGADKTG